MMSLYPVYVLVFCALLATMLAATFHLFKTFFCSAGYEVKRQYKLGKMWFGVVGGSLKIMLFDRAYTGTVGVLIRLPL